MSDKASLDEATINQALKSLSIAGDIANSIKTALLKTEDLTLEEISQYIPIVFPELQNTAFRSMTTSKEGIRNSIQALLEKSVHTSRQANKLIAQDIYILLTEK